MDERERGKENYYSGKDFLLSGMRYLCLRNPLAEKGRGRPLSKMTIFLSFPLFILLSNEISKKSRVLITEKRVTYSHFFKGIQKIDQEVREKRKEQDGEIPICFFGIGISGPIK